VRFLSLRGTNRGQIFNRFSKKVTTRYFSGYFPAPILKYKEFRGKLPENDFVKNTLFFCSLLENIAESPVKPKKVGSGKVFLLSFP